jgi:hypothetical protein
LRFLSILFTNNSLWVTSPADDTGVNESFLLLLCPSTIIVVGKTEIFVSFLLPISSLTKSCRIWSLTIPNSTSNVTW